MKIGLRALLVCLAVGASPAIAQSDSAGELVTRRLAPEQYKQIIADVFGSTIKVQGRFEPDIREDGLLGVGSSRVSVTASGLEQYDEMARAIALQIVAEPHRSTLMPCKPASEREADNACTGQFVAKAGRLLYRRPLSQAEIQAQIAVAAEATKTLHNYYSGLALSLADMLVAPEFLFREEVDEPDPAHTGAYRLDAFSKASRLSFFLWNTAPDDELLAAAESGALDTEKGLSVQADRLLASPRLKAGIRAFFTDMLGFDEFETLTKDTAIYPKFTAQVARDAQEQTLRTITDHLLVRRGDYRDLFTTGRTFLTPVLGAIYGVPVINDSANGTPDTWVPYEYAAGDPRAGLLMQASFVALHSHPGRSSPTLRGKALREILFCQKVPAPPANVNFTVVQDTSNPQYRTVRERLTAHRTDQACAACHKLIDPMGLAMENFDSAGGYRTTENGAPIDASGELDGQAFKDAAGLSRAVHDSPAATSCLVNRAYAYAAGRAAGKGEADVLKSLEKGFAADGYRLPDLFRRIVTSDAFYRVSPPQTGAADAPTPNSVQNAVR